MSETACGFSTGAAGGAGGGKGLGGATGASGAAGVVRADERAELPPDPVERLPGESLEVVRELGWSKSQK